MRRIARWVLSAVAVQVALIGLYWLVEHERASEASDALGTQPPHRVDMAMPPLTVRRRDGSRLELSPSTRPTLVHVWATWCPPCRAELPGLLELPATHAVDVVAIALDEDWSDVERFLNGIDASHVVLAESEDVERLLGVERLPVTFLLQPDELALRFDGARDWTDEAFVNAHLGGVFDDR